MSSNCISLRNRRQRTDRILAEARRLGLGDIRIEGANASPHLSAEFNGDPISVPLALMLTERGDAAYTLLQFHHQLRIAAFRRQ